MSIRILGGALKGRELKAPKSELTRPTAAKVRQAVLNSLQTQISGARVLDWFAGSGAMGFECLSWGASKVFFVDGSKQACDIISQNIKALGLSSQARVGAHLFDFPKLSKKDQSFLSALGQFEIIFVDPPYKPSWSETILTGTPWKEILSPEGVLILEMRSDRKLESLYKLGEFVAPHFRVAKFKTYGDTCLVYFTTENANEKSDVPGVV